MDKKTEDFIAEKIYISKYGDRSLNESKKRMEEEKQKLAYDMAKKMQEKKDFINKMNNFSNRKKDASAKEREPQR